MGLLISNFKETYNIIKQLHMYMLIQFSKYFIKITNCETIIMNKYIPDSPTSKNYIKLDGFEFLDTFDKLEIKK